MDAASHGATVVSQGRRPVRFPLPDGPGIHAAVARRSSTTPPCVDLARRAGAKVLDGHAVTGASRPTTASSSTSTASAPSRPATPSPPTACGRRCARRSGMAGARLPRRLARHSGRTSRNVSERAQRELCVWFEADLLPGYAWSFPLGDGTRQLRLRHPAGRQGAAQDMGAPLGRPARPARHPRGPRRPTRPRERAHTAWPIPARVDSMPRTARRTLFVGDAAAATDLMTGEGIGQALLTGMLAAEAIETAGPHGARIATDALRRAPSTTISSPTTGCRPCWSGPSSTARAPGSPSGSPGSPRGRGATSPAGCSRTTPGPCGHPGRWHAGMFTGDGAYRSEVS